MGRQSSRLYYQGKDHKEIYYDGHYHKAMYIGSQLVWEKLDSTKWQFVQMINSTYLAAGNGLFILCGASITNKTLNIILNVSNDGKKWTEYEYSFEVSYTSLSNAMFFYKNGYFYFIPRDFYYFATGYGQIIRTTNGSDLEYTQVDITYEIADKKIQYGTVDVKTKINNLVAFQYPDGIYISAKVLNQYTDDGLHGYYEGTFLFFSDDMVTWKSVPTTSIEYVGTGKYDYYIMPVLYPIADYSSAGAVWYKDNYFYLSAYKPQLKAGGRDLEAIELLRTSDFSSYERLEVNSSLVSSDEVSFREPYNRYGECDIAVLVDYSEGGSSYTSNFVDYYKSIFDIIKGFESAEFVNSFYKYYLMSGSKNDRRNSYLLRIDKYDENQVYTGRAFLVLLCDSDNNLIDYEEWHVSSINANPYFVETENIFMVNEIVHNAMPGILYRNV